MGVVGSHSRFCIKHAGVPRESALSGLINCSVAVGCRVGRHTCVDLLCRCEEAWMSLLGQEVRRFLDKRPDQTPLIWDGVFHLYYMCDTPSGLKQPACSSSTPSLSGHVFTHAHILVQSLTNIYTNTLNNTTTLTLAIFTPHRRCTIHTPSCLQRWANPICVSEWLTSCS